MDNNQGKINLKITSVIFKGMNYEIKAIDDKEFVWLIQTPNKYDVDTSICIDVRADNIHVMEYNEK